MSSCTKTCLMKIHLNFSEKMQLHLSYLYKHLNHFTGLSDFPDFCSCILGNYKRRNSLRYSNLSSPKWTQFGRPEVENTDNGFAPIK